MTQHQIDCAVAQATGEALETVHQHGFSEPAALEPEEFQLVLDCPFCGHAVAYPGRTRAGERLMAECLGCDVAFDFDDGEVYTTTTLAQSAGAEAATTAA